MTVRYQVQKECRMRDKGFILKSLELKNSVYWGFPTIFGKYEKYRNFESEEGFG